MRLPMLLVGLLFGGLGILVPEAHASLIFFTPATPYLSAADIPAGFYVGGPTALETFEDGTLSFGITASTGSVLAPGGFTDSVDADDGTINGSGTGGRSWFYGGGPPGGVTFTFSGPLPTAAGLVWTDGAGTVTFSVYGAGMVLMGSLGPLSVPSNGAQGSTAADRFYGVQYSGGIQAIRISNSGAGIEIDHVQYGAASAMSAVPEPSSILLALSGIGIAFGLRPRRR